MIQDPGNAVPGAPVDPGGWAWLERVAAEPALVQLTVLALAALFLATLWLRAVRRLRGTAARRVLRDYLLGVEQQLSGDASGALRRLDRVVEAEPGHLEARLFRALALSSLGRGQEAHREHARLEHSAARSSAWNRRGLSRARFEAGDPGSGPDVRLPLPSDPTAPRLLVAPGGGTAGEVMLTVQPVGDPTLRGLESAVRHADAIESNAAHLGRLVERLAGGDGEAADELVALGPPLAVGPLLARLVAEPCSETGVRCAATLARLGTASVRSVVEAWQSLPGKAQDRIDALAGYGVALGVDGLDAFQGLLGGADRTLRKVVLDIHLALADLPALDRVLEDCAPVEVLQRLNEAEHDTLVRVLASLPSDHVLLEVHLTDGAFAREEAVLDAAGQAADPRPLEDLLVRRGATSGPVARAAIDRLGRNDVAESARRVLQRLGAGLREHLIAAYADLDRPPEVRGQVRRCLLDAGPAVVPGLCDAFGSAPSPTDGDLLDLLVDFGADAVPALLEAYQSGGWMERVARRLGRRRNHRRDSIIRALRRIGGPRALAACRTLRERETDHDLSLRIAQAVHVLEAEGAGRVRDEDPPAAGQGGSVAEA